MNAGRHLQSSDEIHRQTKVNIRLYNTFLWIHEPLIYSTTQHTVVEKKELISIDSHFLHSTYLFGVILGVNFHVRWPETNMGLFAKYDSASKYWNVEWGLTCALIFCSKPIQSRHHGCY